MKLPDSPRSARDVSLCSPWTWMRRPQRRPRQQPRRRRRLRRQRPPPRPQRRPRLRRRSWGGRPPPPPHSPLRPPEAAAQVFWRWPPTLSTAARLGRVAGCSFVTRLAAPPLDPLASSPSRACVQARMAPAGFQAQETLCGGALAGLGARSPMTALATSICSASNAFLSQSCGSRRLEEFVRTRCFAVDRQPVSAGLIAPAES